VSKLLGVGGKSIRLILKKLDEKFRLKLKIIEKNRERFGYAYVLYIKPE
jgi:hypothetical protein